MNLLNSAWIPVRTRSDNGRWIAPWQITEGIDSDPVVAIDTPRADFSGTLMQFLIGMLQTAYAPERVSGWERRFREPPTPEALREAFDEFYDCFEFGSQRPSFMEDLDLDAAPDKPIEGLLIEAPGGNTLKENKDFFVKRRLVEGVCPEVAAMALFALQVNAPSGGVGHRTSLRGGGPLTTLVVNEPKGRFDTLWHNAWLNVLTRARFEQLAGDPKRNNAGDRFPWMASTRTSDKQGSPTLPQDAHPLVMYWAMPRRICLDWPGAQSGVCDVTGRETDCLITGYATQNYGANYEGAWRHPLSPYRESANSEPTPLHPQPGGIDYRHWLGLTANRSEISRPAAVIDAWHDDYSDLEELRDQPIYLWAFGYDMDNMKARCWYESLMPLYHIRRDPKRFADRVASFVEAADLAGRYVHDALRRTWFKRPGDVAGDTAFIKEGYWQATESDFYGCVEELARIIDGPAAPDSLEDELAELSKRWHQRLRAMAVETFNHWAATGYFEAEDPGRISDAHNSLMKNLHGKKLRNTLGVSKERLAA